MAIYFGTTEITKLRDLAPQTGLDITDLWFGSTNVYTAWQVYEGTLPATLNANGADMRQYRVYGNTGGVGDDSGTPFGYEVDMRVGSWSPYATHPGTLIDMTTGGENSSPQYSTAYFNNFSPSTAIITVKADTAGGGRTLRYMPYDENQAPMLDYKAEVQFARDGREVQQAVTIPSSAAYYGVSYHNGDTQKKISTTTPIYIGDEPLDKDEYVDYQEGKLFRYGNNIFDLSAKSGANGYVNDGYLTNTGSLQTSSLWYVSEYMDVEFKRYKVVSGIQSGAVIAEYDENKNFLTAHAYTSGIKITFEVISNCKYLRMSVYKNAENSTSLNALQPTDPPVPLPALPTCEGTTIVDYSGSEAVPEKVLLKCRKEGF